MQKVLKSEMNSNTQCNLEYAKSGILDPGENVRQSVSGTW